MLAAGRNLAVIAGMENILPAIAADANLAGEHHDPRIEIMFVQVLGKTRLLTPANDIEPLAPQVAFERRAR